MIAKVDSYVFQTAGFGKGDVLKFDPNPIRCGQVEDGVSVMIPGLSGWGVIAYEDLLEMARLAKERRER